MDLQRLGRVINVTPSKNIIVKAEKAPKIGSAVVDENLQTIGNGFDVIGPVPSPYAVVRPVLKEPEKLTNKQLYLSDSERGRGRNR